MKMQSSIKNSARIVVAAMLGLIILGYIIASLAQPSIGKVMRQEANSSSITGISFGGQRVLANNFKVGSKIEWPFVVIGYFSVPFDLHATVHATTYLVLPWGKYTLSKQVDHLL